MCENKENVKETLEEEVVKLLLERGWSITTAESCTGGLCAKRITDVPGASSVFHCGVVSYSNEIKNNILYHFSKFLSISFKSAFNPIIC